MIGANEKALLGVIGLCRGAGRLVIGVPMICEELKKGAKRHILGQDGYVESVIVIEASDSSENTHKRIADKCEYYKIRRIRIDSDCITLGGALGKGAVAAVMINDAGFCRAIEKKLAD